MATICPFCSTEVSESSIEAEDGCCPECGAVISVSNAYMGGDDGGDEDEYEENPSFDIDEDDDSDFADFDEDYTFDDFEEEGFEEFDFGDEAEEEEEY